MAEYHCYIGLYDPIDIAPYIEEISWEINDLDAPKSGRDLGGDMHRGKTAEKNKLYFKLVPITAAVLNRILPKLRTEYTRVDTDMVPDGNFTGYNTQRKGGVCVITTDGLLKHKDVTFNIIGK